MGWFSTFTESSIGKKFVVAFTGFLLMLFLLLHLGGNLTLYFGEDSFNTYVKSLHTVEPIIRIIEVLLALVFIFHIVNGVRLWLQNKKARPISYKINGKRENTDIYSRSTFITGSIIFIFLVLHLSTFWYAFNVTGEAVKGDVTQYYNIVITWFQSPWYSIVYIIAMILLGYHLNHGFQSAFQTFGWNHKKYTPFIKGLGTFYAIVMAAGFASIPIYFLFFYGGS